MSLPSIVAERLAHSGVLAIRAGESLVWCELGWFICAGVTRDSDNTLIKALMDRGARITVVTTELEALSQATLWAIADGRKKPIAPDMVGIKRSKYLTLVK